MTKLSRLLVGALLVGSALVLVTSGPLRAIATDDGPVLDSVKVESIVRDIQPQDGTTQHLERRLTIQGSGFYGTAFGPFVSFEMADGRVVPSPFVVLQDENTLVAWAPEGCRGPATLVVRNPDRRRATVAVDL